MFRIVPQVKYSVRIGLCKLEPTEGARNMGIIIKIRHIGEGDMFKSTRSEIFVDQNNVKSNMSFDFNSNRFI